MLLQQHNKTLRTPIIANNIKLTLQDTYCIDTVYKERVRVGIDPFISSNLLGTKKTALKHINESATKLYQGLQIITVDAFKDNVELQNTIENLEKRIAELKKQMA
ncbi:MAG: hypothetical protein WC979_02475 [Candidatus Pacearchaeota archaeon]|nr:hypothetical protein [Clostridia bacterium]